VISWFQSLCFFNKRVNLCCYSVAEVKLTQMAPDPRLKACAQIMAFVNEGVLDQSGRDGGDAGGGDFDNLDSPAVANGSPAVTKRASFAKGGKDGSPDSHLGPGRLSRNNSLTLRRTPSGVGGGGGGMQNGIVVANGTLAPRPVVNIRNTQNFTEATEYADYVAEKLIAMPAMRRNQVVQVVDLLSDAFACGQSVPATRLLGGPLQVESS
jgi:hypothetical protein